MTTGLDGKGWGDTDKGVWIGAKTYGAQQLQAYSFFDGQTWGNACNLQSCQDNDKCKALAAYGGSKQSTINSLTNQCNSETQKCLDTLVKWGLISDKSGKIDDVNPSNENHRHVCMRSKVSGCHDNYVNTAHGCLQFFPHAGKNTVLYGGHTGTICSVNGGGIVRLTSNHKKGLYIGSSHQTRILCPPQFM